MLGFFYWVFSFKNINIEIIRLTKKCPNIFHVKFTGPKASMNFQIIQGCNCCDFIYFKKFPNDASTMAAFSICLETNTGEVSSIKVLYFYLKERTNNRFNAASPQHFSSAPQHVSSSLTASTDGWASRFIYCSKRFSGLLHVLVMQLMQPD
jgi:hypothetical protein